MKKYIACTLIFFAFAAGIRSADTVSAAASLADDTASLIRMIEKESPLLYRQLEQMPRKEILQMILSSLNCGVEPAETQNHHPQHYQGIKKIYPGKLIDGNLILYLRIDTLNKQSLIQLKSDLEQVNRLKQQCHGVILDLRNAATHPQGVSIIPEFLNVMKTMTPGKSPAAVLCGKNTAGLPELFAALLEKLRLGITMGSAGSGDLYRQKSAECAGTLWMIPEIPEDLPFVAPGKHQPMVALPDSPQIPFDEIGKKRKAVDDPAVRRAADLLKSLHAIR